MRSQFLESLAGRLKGGLQPADRLKTAQAHVAIERIEFESKTAPDTGDNNFRALLGECDGISLQRIYLLTAPVEGAPTA